MSATGKSNWSPGELLKEALISFAVHKTTEGGKGGHGKEGGNSHAELTPFAQALGRIADVAADKLEKWRFRDEIQQAIMARLVLNKHNNLLALHRKAMARDLRFEEGREVIVFKEDDVVDLLGNSHFKVSDKKDVHRTVREQGHGKKPTIVDEHETQEVKVVERGKDELAGKTVDESLAALEEITGEAPIIFLQYLAGLKREGLGGKVNALANRAADNMDSWMDGVAEVRLFAGLGPRLVRGLEPSARRTPTPTNFHPDDLDEPLPPPPKQGWFESREEFFPRLERWTADRNMVAARNRERQRLRDERARNGGAS